MKINKLFNTLLLVVFACGTLSAINVDPAFCTVPCNDENREIAAPNPGKDYDFSYLKPGETADLAYNDNKGNPIRYRITRTTGGIDIAIYQSSLENADPATRITFKGPNGVVSSKTVGEIKAQRCGWLCLVAHALCVKIHIGPPGNTWEWNCKDTNEN